jgi:hypothetical protein
VASLRGLALPPSAAGFLGCVEATLIPPAFAAATAGVEVFVPLGGAGCPPDELQQDSEASAIAAAHRRRE